MADPVFARISAASPHAHAQKQQLRVLEAKVAYLLDQVSDLSAQVRHLTAAEVRKGAAADTRESFDYQWGNLPEGESMLSNPTWRDSAAEQICEITGLARSWFAGKRVLDAGCGQGRWTYGFGQLGVAECIAIDQSSHGVAATQKIADEAPVPIRVVQGSLLEPHPELGEFDLVWCFGVLHHTGDTFGGFQHLAPRVQMQGHLFLMLYGEPRSDCVGDFDYYHQIHELRRQTRNLPLADKIEFLAQRFNADELHGYFDAVSPPINDLYSWDEIEAWLLAAGFAEIRRTRPEVANHHLVARRIAEPPAA